MSDNDIQIPAWFVNGEMPDPCLCGRPLQHGEPYLIAEDTNGQRRWFHLTCWQMMMHSFGDGDEI